ncbi:MAG: DUF4276 family protein [Blastocatellia bacterium]|nr:DUF4276 family protein [Blastocatellia bacterium]
MKKVLILAEGQTEETFIKQILAPHLLPLDVSPVPIIIATKRLKSGTQFKGGVPSYEKVRKEIQRLLGDSSAALVTTMIDYYGLPKSFPGRAAVQGATPLERVRFVEDALSSDINHPRFVPYYSLHEFEALLFASTSAIAEVFARPDLEQQLAAIRAAFPTPEDIDDAPVTAPSARLESLYPRYSKPFFGPRIAARIGIRVMREECNHFGDWLARLEEPDSV